MELLIFYIILLPFLLIIVFGNLIPIYKNHKEATGIVMNYDSFMRKFVYRTDCKKDTIIRLLNTKNDVDELVCTFDFENSAVKISEYGSHVEYRFQIHEHPGFSILSLEQIPTIAMQSHVPYKLNPFMVRKISAEIIPFSEHYF